ncbi:hypothetical protein [Xanthomonas sp. WHRI 8356]
MNHRIGSIAGLTQTRFDRCQHCGIVLVIATVGNQSARMRGLT